MSTSVSALFLPGTSFSKLSPPAWQWHGRGEATHLSNSQNSQHLNNLHCDIGHSFENIQSTLYNEMCCAVLCKIHSLKCIGKFCLVFLVKFYSPGAKRCKHKHGCRQRQFPFPTPNCLLLKTQNGSCRMRLSISSSPDKQTDKQDSRFSRKNNSTSSKPE